MTELASWLAFPEERVLLPELNHRINNEFASAINVVSLAAARSGNEAVRAALTGVTELLHRYAEVHRALQMPQRDSRMDGLHIFARSAGLAPQDRVIDSPPETLRS